MLIDTPTAIPTIRTQGTSGMREWKDLRARKPEWLLGNIIYISQGNYAHEVSISWLLKDNPI